MMSLREPVFKRGVMRGRFRKSHASEEKSQLARFIFDNLFQVVSHDTYCTTIFTKILSSKKNPDGFRMDHALT